MLRVHAVDFDTNAAGRGHLIDEGGHVRRAYGNAEGALIVVRPDGYIGFVGSRTSWDAVGAYLRGTTAE